MDVLKFIALLPLKVVYFLRFIIQILWRVLCFAMSPIIGKITWDQPEWAKETSTNIDKLDDWAEDHKFKASGAILAILLIASGGIYFYNWHVNHPKTMPVQPELITFQTEGPFVRDYNEPYYSNSAPTVFYVNFTGSVAPLEGVNKEITSGIRTSPEIEGTWEWYTDKSIVFRPKHDWIPGSEFTVTFSPKDLLAPHVLVKDTKTTLTVPPMTASVDNSYFYDDPTDPVMRRTFTEIVFNYPVDPVEFEKHITLKMSGPGIKETPVKFNVTYNESKLRAFIQSEPLDMPEKQNSVSVDISKGFTSSLGGKPINTGCTANISVPSKYSLNVNDINAMIIDNNNNEPDQVLVVELNHAVKDSSMNKAIKAYILPPRVYDTAKDEYNWNDVSDIDEKILKQSKPLTLTPIPTEEEYSPVHSYKFEAAPGENATIYIMVDKNIQSFSGYKMAKNYFCTQSVPDYPTLLDFVSEGSLLSLSGDHKLTVVSRNIKGIELIAKRVLPGQLQHMVSINKYGDYTKPALDDYSYIFGENNITERFETKIAISDPDPVKPHYDAIDMSQFFGPQGKGQRGIFIVRIRSYEPKTENDDENSPEEDGDGYGDYDYDDEYHDYSYNRDYSYSDEVLRLIVVTDLGILVKTSLDKSHDVYVQSIHSGEPVANAKVDVLGLNGEVLMSQTTGIDGHVSFPKFDNFQREKTPTLYLVTKGDDSSFLPVRREYSRSLSYSRFDTSGINTPKDSGKLSAHLFSDRGIYRPGDTFHIGMIVKAHDWNKSLTGLPLQLNIYDPRGQIMQEKKINLSQAGFEEFSYTTTENDVTGFWEADLYLIKDEENDVKDFIGSTSIQVKEFLPDRLEVKAVFSAEQPKGWVKPEGLNALVNVQNLFGTPAQDRLVEGKITLKPVLPSFRGFSDYTFRSRQTERDGMSEDLPSQQSDAEGNAVFDLDLASRVDSTYQLRFLAKAYEADSGRNVAASANILVSPEDFLVGIKTDGDMGYVDLDSERSIALIAVDSELEKVSSPALKVRIQEKKYVSVLTKDEYSGIYSYVSKLRTDNLSTDNLTIAASGKQLKLPTDKPGNFVVQVLDDKNDVLNWIEYSVVGQANITRSLERSAELDLKIPQKDYAPGEEIEIAINAPYSGSGLITIERDKVYAHTWFVSPTTSSIQKIKIPNDFVGNGYINVQFIRDPNSPEIFLSPLSYGVLPFKTNLDSKRAKIDIQAPSLLKPGDTLDMRVATPQPERVVVFAVDEGILQVARYSLEDPLDTLLPKRTLQVSTEQILDLILPTFKMIMAQSSAPGGGDDSSLSRHLNPFRRKTDAPVAYWSGIIDVTGQKDLTYEIPDYFNGRLRIMAVAVSSNGIGIFQTTATVRDDFILTPNIPAVVAPGDTFDVTVGIANNLENLDGREIPITLSFAGSDQVEAVEGASQTVNLGEKKEGVVTFKLKAKDNLGAAKLTFTAAFEDKKSIRTAETSVRPAEAYRTELQIGRMDEKAVGIKKLRNMYDEYAIRNASASYLPLVMNRGLTSYLVEFPHTCTEQLISRGIPYLMQQKHPEFYQNILDQAEAAKVHSSILAMIAARQNSQGGIGTWQATPEANDFVTAYALHYMLELKDSGIAVPDSLVKNTTAYLHSYADNPAFNSLNQLRLKAYIAYLTARQEQLPTNILAAVQKDLTKYYPKELENDIASAYIAATYKLLKQDKEAEQYIKYSVKMLSRTTANKDWTCEYYYDPLVRDAGMLYILETHFPEHAAKIPPEALENITRPLIENRFNTLSSAMSILALDKYATRIQKEINSRDESTGLGGIVIKQLNSNDEHNIRIISEVSGLLAQGGFDKDAKVINVEKGSDLPAWYVVQQSGFDRDTPTTPIKEGIEVVREYFDEQGNPVSEVKLGQEVIVLVKIRSTSENTVGDAVIVDLLPGGFEHVAPEDISIEVPESIIYSAADMDMEHFEEREDRALIYCQATSEISGVYYIIRATNSGEYTVPALYGESMYDRTIQARSIGGTKIKVTK